MGAALPTRAGLMRCTAEEVARVAEARTRPGVVARTIRDHEIDGATLLVLADGDVLELARSTLDGKKLLGAFRELDSDLRAEDGDLLPRTPQCIALTPNLSSSTWKSSSEQLAISPQLQHAEEEDLTRATSEVVAPAFFIAPSSSSSSSCVPEGEVTTTMLPEEASAWNSLSSVERAKLGSLFEALHVALEEARLLLVAFLLDPRNQLKHARYGAQPMVYQSQAAQAREPVLAKIREIQTREATAVVDFVATLERNALSLLELFNHQQPEVLHAQEEKEVLQPLDAACFDGVDASTTLKREHWDSAIGETLDRACAVLAERPGLAKTHPAQTTGDEVFLALKIDGRDGRATALGVFYAHMLLLAPKFENAMRDLFGRRSRAAVIMPSQRAKEIYAGSAVVRPWTRACKDAVSVTVCCKTHAEIEAAHGTLRHSTVLAGNPRDNRREKNFDLVQPVWFMGHVLTVRFVLEAIATLEPLAADCSAIKRASTVNLQPVRAALFDFPTVHLENHSATANFVKLKLHILRPSAMTASS